MASIIREGGPDPLVVNSWQEAVKLQLLEHIYDQNGQALVGNIRGIFDEEINFIEERWKHRPTMGDYKLMLQEIFTLGWVEVSEYVCSCCLKQTHEPTEILKHAVRLKLTNLGYSKVPEHIFP